jgi:hypothetical protein
MFRSLRAQFDLGQVAIVTQRRMLKAITASST